MMDEQGKSDRPVVSTKLPNESEDTFGGWATWASMLEEAIERRGLVEGNLQGQNTHRIQSRKRVQNALERVRQAGVRDKQQRFTALMHHIYSVDMLEEAYFSLKRDASAGIDGETWSHYGERLEENLQDLSERLKRGAYRARPVKRTYIPKADGRQRPLGVPVLEDKIVQCVAAAVLGAIYETDFLGFSYGYRPKRSQHKCLDALYVGLQTKWVNWVLDADIQGFFDHISHEWLIKFIEHRIADKRVVRLIQKWLKAGVLKKGQWQASVEGTPQGGVISPLLANIFLHYVFDLWIQQWRKFPDRGDMIVVRWADDFIVGFQKEEVARRFLSEIGERFKKFGLTLHPEKTRLLEFGRYAIDNRRRRGQGRPESFNFLGFTHICGKKHSNGMFVVIRKTIGKRLRAKLQEVKIELKRRMHEPVPKVGKWLKAVVGGYNRYFGIPTNLAALHTFRFQIARYWHHMLKRRSQKTRITWERVDRLIERWLPCPEIHHPYPLRRMGVIT